MELIVRGAYFSSAFVPRILVAVFVVLAPASTVAGDGPKAGVASHPADDLKSPWHTAAGVSIRQGYDSNVYCYPVEQYGQQGSAYTSVRPSFRVTYDSAPVTGSLGPESKELAGGAYADDLVWSIGLGYTGDYSFYYDTPLEDYRRHQMKLDVSALSGPWTVAFSSLGRFTEGDDRGLVWTGIGGAPAFGNYEARDRRENLFAYADLAVQRELPDQWFARLVVRSWMWDFRVRHDPATQNFHDRMIIDYGADIGREVTPGFTVYLGYRHNVQDQMTSPTRTIPYDNEGHRLVLGVDGQPLPWLIVHAEFGPVFREFLDPRVRWHKHSEHWDLDIFLSAQATSLDTLQFLVRRWQLPASAGSVMFDDQTYRLTWMRAFAEDDTVAGLSLQPLKLSLFAEVYSEDFFPALRFDRRLSAGITAAYQLTSHAKIAIDYRFEATATPVGGVSARDYERHQTAVEFGFAF